MHVSVPWFTPVPLSGLIHGSDTIIKLVSGFNYLTAGLFPQIIFLPVSIGQVCMRCPAVLTNNNRENYTYDAGKD
ncbi:hypothetical protein DSECCO2_535460 [anaerobic digester metagenome]